MRYKVVGRCLGRNFTFNLLANDRQEATKDAIEHLKATRWPTNYADLALQVTCCTRTKIEISGMNDVGEPILIALVSSFPEMLDEEYVD